MSSETQKNANTTTQQRCGFAAVLGLPNAGKSTMINALVGEKVSITSRKAQTTRMQIKGIALHDNAQIVLIDTPGVFQAKKHFDTAMVEAAWAGLDEAEMCLLIVDVSQKNCIEAQSRVLKRLSQTNKKAWLILNKIDKCKKERLLEITAALNAQADFEKTFMISALKEHGVKDLKSNLAAEMPLSPWMYDPDQITDISMKLLAAEITREQVYDQLHDELPYAIHVETEEWEDFKNGDLRIGQIIYVHRKMQKAIFLGKGGERIKRIGQRSREEIGEILERKVHLSLFVKVKENWQDQVIQSLNDVANPENL